MLHPINIIKAVFAGAVFAASALAVRAQAATLFVGDSRGSFGAPLIDLSVDSEAMFRVENPNAQTEAFLLGEPGPNSAPNQLSFTGQKFSTPTQQSFSVGRLTYRNGQTFQGTNVSSVPLGINLNLIQPSQVQRSFDYQFTFDLTPNNSEIGSADSLTISENPAPQTLFVQQEEFSLELLGFSSDNGNTFTRKFQVPEDQSTESTLFAQISPVRTDIQQPVVPPKPATEVPEPAVLSGLLVLSAAMSLKHASDR